MKKLFVCFISISLIVTLVACGQSSEFDISGTDEPMTTPTAETTETPNEYEDIGEEIPYVEEDKDVENTLPPTDEPPTTQSTPERESVINTPEDTPTNPPNIAGQVRPPNQSNLRIGSVRLIANGIEYEPRIYMEHAARYTSEGGLLNASGVPFCAWLRDNLSRIPRIQYTGNLQLVVEGDQGHISGSHPFINRFHIDSMYRDELRIIEIFNTDFSDGIANISLPNEPGIYLIGVHMSWRNGREFSRQHHFFKVIK